MKKIIQSMLFCLLANFTAQAQQVPQAIHYQAIARDNAGKPMTEKIDVEFNIRDGSANGTIVYAETHNDLKPNSFGLFFAEIGRGGQKQGDFSMINWASGLMFLETEVDGKSLGTVQLLTVPYAFFAESANERQQLDFNPTTRQLSISSGNTVVLPGIGQVSSTEITDGSIQIVDLGFSLPQKLDDLTDVSAALPIADGKVLKWDVAAGAWLPKNDETGTGFTGTLDGLTDVNTAGATAGQVLQWNSSTQIWEPKTLTAPGDDWGSQTVQTNITKITGDGKAVPLSLAANAVTDMELSNNAVTAPKIDKMGATNGQVLKWNNTANRWEPSADEKGVGGDDWGIQKVQTVPAKITGDGDATPLSLAANAVTAFELADNAVTAPKIDKMGATNGQVLKWNNTANRWEPSPDQTGIATVEVSTPLLGDGSAGSPIQLAPGNSFGDVLFWDGSQWIPQQIASSDWSIFGNSGTDASFNFIGTTDDQPISFRTNFTERMRLERDGRLQLFNSQTETTIVGQAAGEFNTGWWNSFFGTNAGKLTTGNNNSFFGAGAGISNTSAYDNSFFGQAAGASTTTGGSNSFFGEAAGLENVGGQYNSFFGRWCGQKNLTNGNSFFGASAGQSNTWGGENCFFGFEAGQFNETEGGNTFMGYQAGKFNTGGSLNCFYGGKAGYKNISGDRNSFFGVWAGYNNTTAGGNSFFGREAGLNNISGEGNNFFGEGAGGANTTGMDNCFFGNTTGFSNQSGRRNICVGTIANIQGIDFEGDICLGFNAATFGNYNSIAIGIDAQSNASNKAVIGNLITTSSIGGRFGWSTLSDARFKTNIRENVPGLALLNLLRPVSYRFDVDGMDKFLGTTARRAERGDTVSLREIEARREAAAVTVTGFLAQEVEQAARSLGYEFSGVDAPANEKDTYGLRYGDFVPVLVKAVQEQQQIIEQQRQQLENQGKMLTDLQANLEALAQSFKQLKAQIDR